MLAKSDGCIECTLWGFIGMNTLKEGKLKGSRGG